MIFPWKVLGVVVTITTTMPNTHLVKSMSWTGVRIPIKVVRRFRCHTTKIPKWSQWQRHDRKTLKYVSTISTTGMTHSTNTMTVNGPIWTSSTLTRVYVPHPWEGTWKDETVNFSEEQNKYVVFERGVRECHLVFERGARECHLVFERGVRECHLVFERGVRECHLRSSVQFENVTWCPSVEFENVTWCSSVEFENYNNFSFPFLLCHSSNDRFNSRFALEYTHSYRARKSMLECTPIVTKNSTRDSRSNTITQITRISHPIAHSNRNKITENQRSNVLLIVT